MKLKELKNWIESLPKEFLEFDIVSGEEGRVDNENGKYYRNNIYYRHDKPIISLNVDEESKEILLLHDETMDFDKLKESVISILKKDLDLRIIPHQGDDGMLRAIEIIKNLNFN